MNLDKQPPTSSFEIGLEALLRRRLASFRAETSGLHPSSSRFQDLAQGLLADARLLETSAWALKSECNTQHSAVNTLPPEILSQVFTMVAETERPLPPYDLRALGSFEARLDEYGVAHAHDDGTFGDVEETSWLKGRRGTLGWIALSHVCNLWRRLLLTSSALWAGDVGALPDALHTMLERAGNTRFLIVRVYGATFRRHDTALWKLMTANDGAIARRIREIHYVERRLGYLQEEVFPHLASCPLLALEKLIISAYEDVGEGVAVITAPLLRAAAFTNATCMFTSSALTELSIVGTVPDNSDLWTWEPQLQDLRTILEAHRHTLLHLCLDVTPRDHLSPETRIDFPKLQSLKFCGLSILPDSLIYNMTYPQSSRAYVNVNPLTSRLHAQELHRFISALQRAGSVTPHGLAIEETVPSSRYNDQSLLLRFYAAPSAHARSQTAHIEDEIFGIDTLQLAVTLQPVHVPLRTVLEALSASIPMAGVRTLSFTSPCAPCRNTGALLLDYFPGVQTFHLVDACDRDSVLPYLSQSGTAGPRMPMLERLFLSQKSKTHVLSTNWLAQQLLARYGHHNAPNNLATGTLARLKELVIHQSVIVAKEKEFTQAVTAIWGLADSLSWQGNRVIGMQMS